jgi:flavin reductase (DIM6/NTAB) family NADH-FMN oxidoreductase RutF
MSKNSDTAQLNSGNKKQEGHVSWKPGTLIYPVPAVIVSCGASPEEFNLLTISWVGTICTNPPMCYISVRPERHSYEIIKKNMEFVINLTNEEMAYATDWCGVKSGKEYNKFEEMNLHPGEGQMVSAPIIKESPLCIECKVKEIVKLGSHDMFIAEVVNVQADSKYIHPETDTFNLATAKLIAYSHGHYYKLGEEIGKFGWSVQKKK